MVRADVLSQNIDRLNRTYKYTNGMNTFVCECHKKIFKTLYSLKKHQSKINSYGKY